MSLVRTAPLLSFVWQRGVCFACGGRIDPLHLGGEVAGALVLASAFAVAPLGRALLLSALGLALLAAALCDAKVRRLPDPLTVVVALVATGLAALRSFEALAMGAACALVTFLVMEGVRRTFLWRRGKPGLGFGDIKLLAALAPWIGLHMPWAVAAAALLGLTVAILRPSPDGRHPFGPFLAIAAWTIGIVGEAGLWPLSG